MNTVKGCTRLNIASSPSGESMETVLQLLNDEFERLNYEYFNSKLKRPHIEFSQRKSFGGYYQKLRHRIVLSWQAYTEHGMDETMNTFRHEVAHIVHQHHRKEFWELANLIGVTKKYAASPTTPKARATRWYTYQCPACLGKLQRRRRITANASCAQCDSKYNSLYNLQLIATEIK